MAMSIPVSRRWLPHPSREFHVALWIIAAWVAMTLVETAKTYINLRIQGAHPSVFALVQTNLPWWLGWMLLTWPIVALSRRLRIDTPRQRVAAAVTHLVAGSITSFAYTAAITVVYFRIGLNPQGPPLETRIANWLNMFFISNLFTYGVVACLAHAAVFARRYRESAVAAARMATEVERVRHHATEARLQALQRELNPHFLFNTLNAVSGLVRKSEGPAAVAMLARLADLLRATLDRDDVETALADEVSLLELYLDIERARFGERLTITVSMPADIADALVPTFCLQPLAENAVRHGIARCAEPWFIHIAAEAQGDTLVITVENSGSDAVTEAFVGTDVGGMGVGLSNTRARLAQLYGSRAAVELEARPDCSAIARVRLPLHRHRIDSWTPVGTAV
jgi:hypothetical protein